MGLDTSSCQSESADSGGGKEKQRTGSERALREPFARSEEPAKLKAR